MVHSDFKFQRLSRLTLPEESEDCAGARAGLPLRKTFNFTPHEDVYLDVVREILAMYASADARHWHAALEYTEMHFNDACAVSFVARATNFVRGLRAERHCPFNFLTFRCSHITSDELAMMSALQTARHGPEYVHKDALQYLAQSASFNKLERAVRELADLLEAPAAPSALQTSAREPATKASRARHPNAKLD